MKITTPMRITAADSESRTITGQIVAFDVAANASTGKVLFQAGSIQPASVKLNLEHDSARPIGRSIDMRADASGMNATFKISQTSAGTDALVEAMDGLRDGFSVEAEATEFAYNEDGTMVVSQAQLVGVALTHNPAFDAARVERVAATEGEEVSESTEDAEEPTTTEGDEVENAVTNAEAVESVEAAKSITAAATAVGYTKPRLDFSAPKHLEMSIKAALGSEEARSYIAAAADTTDNAGLVPTRQLSTVINGLANATRSNIDAISRGTLPDAGMSFEIPKITQLPSVTEEAEAGTVADVDQNSEFLSVSVKKYSGSQTFSVELFDRSSPLFIDELMRNMAAQYAKVTDTAVNAALIAGATADGTTTTTYPTAAELLGIIARGAASVYNGTQGFARNLVVNTSQWSNLMTLNDAGRPIYNASQPSNAGGVVRPDSVRGNVAGLDLYVTANTAATTDTDGSILVINPDAYTWYESPTYQLRADVIATGQISVMMYGYGAIATKIGAGAFKNNKQ
ncbi:Prohead protease [uncultured Caudovirales phage]|uniref:Prohead protease n=1 Tax=uncultured Caudovirales phage TaxID=2100421 RepID=A0A6J5NW34_9CAUD|nr:Prohead protease [uncultured Caudovirales phage]